MRPGLSRCCICNRCREVATDRCVVRPDDGQARGEIRSQGQVIQRGNQHGRVAGESVDSTISSSATDFASQHEHHATALDYSAFSTQRPVRDRSQGHQLHA